MAHALQAFLVFVMDKFWKLKKSLKEQHAKLPGIKPKKPRQAAKDKIRKDEEKLRDLQAASSAGWFDKLDHALLVRVLMATADTHCWFLLGMSCQRCQPCTVSLAHPT